MTSFVIEVGGRTYRRHPKHGHWELVSHAGTWLMVADPKTEGWKK